MAGHLRAHSPAWSDTAAQLIWLKLCVLTSPELSSKHYPGSCTIHSHPCEAAAQDPRLPMDQKRLLSHLPLLRPAHPSNCHCPFSKWHHCPFSCSEPKPTDCLQPLPDPLRPDVFIPQPSSLFTSNSQGSLLRISSLAPQGAVLFLNHSPLRQQTVL